MDDSFIQQPINVINDHHLNWAVNHNISNVAINDLLSILSKHHCFKTLPKDSRTCLRTDLSSKKIKVKNVEPGSYFHFGMAKCIKIFYPIKNHINDDCIKLVIGIDGLPLSKSSGSSFWPILCYIRPYKETVFPVGIYWGYKKPEDSNAFLVDFYDELSNLIKKGIVFEF